MSADDLVILAKSAWELKRAMDEFVSLPEMNCKIKISEKVKQWSFKERK